MCIENVYIYSTRVPVKSIHFFSTGAFKKTCGGVHGWEARVLFKADAS